MFARAQPNMHILMILPLPGFGSMSRRRQDSHKFVGHVEKTLGGAWEISDSIVHGDLAPPVKAMFGKRPDTEHQRCRSASIKAKWWTLRFTILQSLYEKSLASCFGDLFNVAAKRRVSTLLGKDWHDEDIQVVPLRVDLHLFPTGIAFLVVEWSYFLSSKIKNLIRKDPALFAKLITEINYSLSHSRGKAEQPPDSVIAVEGFVATLIQSLDLSEEGLSYLPRRRRSILYTYLADEWIGVSDDELHNRCQTLAHVFSSDYSPKVDTYQKPLQTFTSLIHSGSLDGACTMVRLNGLHFLDVFFLQSIREAYLPLLLTVLHERVFLNTIARWSSSASLAGGRLRLQLALATHLQDALLEHRLSCRFESGSDNSIHDLVLRYWRGCLQISSLQLEVLDDVRQVELHLNSRLREFWDRIGKIGGAFGVVWSLDAFFQIHFKEYILIGVEHLRMVDFSALWIMK
ncbi:hypothetical protein [Propionivibrio sp.]|uniref:hypothetical protein n=1 Tax=Propionivibrio sp. TaxID=2212460 RepID=UPI003BF1B0B2